MVLWYVLALSLTFFAFVWHSKESQRSIDINLNVNFWSKSQSEFLVIFWQKLDLFETVERKTAAIRLKLHFAKFILVTHIVV